MWQITDNLYVGRYRDTINLALLQAHNIDAMLQLAERIEQPGIEVLYLAVEDGAPLPAERLRQGVSFARNHLAAGRCLLIACSAGISRSVSFAVAVLYEEQGLSLLDAFRKVLAAHTEALPHPVLWKSLCDYYGQDISVAEILRAWSCDNMKNGVARGVS